MAIRRLDSIKETIAASWKLFLSFRKRDWELRDYPIVMRIQDTGNDLEFTAPRFVRHRYVARVVKWWSLSGGGDTPEAAMRDLASNFEQITAQGRREGEPLPRPGMIVPVEFTSQERVNTQTELAEDFVRRVLGLDWAWISDGSSLWDFHTSATNDALYAKIRELYGIDVSDVESGNLAQILERIAAPRP